MKCYEVRNCSEEERSGCYVWNCFRETPEDFEQVKCWVLKEAYNKGNEKQLKQCRECKYYLMQNRQAGVVSDYRADVAVISCEGVINNDRTRALEKVWENFKQNGKNKVLLNIRDVNNIYSCGLGMLIKIHKESQSLGGGLVVLGAEGYTASLFESTKLNRILTLVNSDAEAGAWFASLQEKTAPKEEPVAKQPPKERPPCYVYFENRNPKNATNCDECFRKIKPSSEPCWIVEGMIEGISFQYVNEDCDDCPYFQEFSGRG